MSSRKTDDDDDFGLRTPTKRAPDAAPRKTDTGRRKRDEPREADPPKAKDTGKRRAVAPVEPAPARAADPAPARAPAKAPAKAGARVPLPAVLGGLVLALGVGGGAIALLSGGPEPAPTPSIGTSAASAPVAPPRVEVTRQPPVAPPRALPSGPTPAPVAADPAPVAAPIAPPPAAPKVSTLEDLAARSPEHAAIARLLEDYLELTRDLLSPSPNPFQDASERERREQELLDRLRAMGPGVIPALAEMLTELNHRANQVFLAKALAGMPYPEATGAIEQALGQLKDVALQTTLVRYLPETPDAAALVTRAFGNEENPTLRGMLLREYSRRIGDEAGQTGAARDTGREFLRQAALNDPDPNVRAEAVTVIGQRADPRDQELMAQLARSEPNVYLRQRAIVSYAETAKEGSLGLLDDMARDAGAGLPIRASAILAISRVGGPLALQALDRLAQTDPDQEVRTRAQRAAASMRARAEAEARGQGPQEVPGGAIRVGPPPDGLQRR